MRRTPRLSHSIHHYRHDSDGTRHGDHNHFVEAYAHNDADDDDDNDCAQESLLRCCHCNPPTPRTEKADHCHHHHGRHRFECECLRSRRKAPGGSDRSFLSRYPHRAHRGEEEEKGAGGSEVES